MVRLFSIADRNELLMGRTTRNAVWPAHDLIVGAGKDRAEVAIYSDASVFRRVDLTLPDARAVTASRVAHSLCDLQALWRGQNGEMLAIVVCRRSTGYMPIIGQDDRSVSRRLIATGC